MWSGASERRAGGGRVRVRRGVRARRARQARRGAAGRHKRRLRARRQPADRRARMRPSVSGARRAGHGRGAGCAARGSGARLALGLAARARRARWLPPPLHPLHLASSFSPQPHPAHTVESPCHSHSSASSCVPLLACTPARACAPPAASMSSYDKLLRAATKPKAGAPKAKHIDPLIAASFARDGSLEDVLHALAQRLREGSTVSAEAHGHHHEDGRGQQGGRRMPCAARTRSCCAVPTAAALQPCSI